MNYTQSLIDFEKGLSRASAPLGKKARSVPPLAHAPGRRKFQSQRIVNDVFPRNLWCVTQPQDFFRADNLEMTEEANLGKRN
jgi:hypothetical protein